MGVLPRMLYAELDARYSGSLELFGEDLETFQELPDDQDFILKDVAFNLCPETMAPHK